MIKLSRWLLRIGKAVFKLLHLPIMWELRASYLHGRKRAAKMFCYPEETSHEILDLDQKLRIPLIKQYEQKYHNSKYRLLFQMPNTGVGTIWFKDLIQCLEHVGIPVASIDRDDLNFQKTWEEFQPNVFITMDKTEVLKSLDLEYIRNYKYTHGCLRLFTPINTYRFPKPGLSPEDRWRLELASNGKSTDAYFSMMESEYFDNFFSAWVEVGFQYLPLPHGCNPLKHSPKKINKDLDYFMATSCGPDRIRLTRQYMKPIFKRYNGLWAGSGWDFGYGPISHQDLPEFYARARIIPNPLAKFLIEFQAEITERAFSAAICGAFQITNRTPVTNRFFISDELVTVSSKKEFFEAFEYYIHRPEERNKFIERSFIKVLSSHTYFHRIDKLLSFLGTHSDLF